MIHTETAKQSRSGRHDISRKQALMAGLFVEEMAVNVLQHAQKKDIRDFSIDFRLFISDSTVCFSMTDLSELFDPTSFHELHQYDSAEEHIGIRTVMNAAREVRYFSNLQQQQSDRVYRPLII